MTVNESTDALHEKLIFKHFVRSWYATKYEVRAKVMTLLNNIIDKFIRASAKIEESKCTDRVSTFAVINSYMCHAFKRTSFVASHQMAFHFHPREYANPHSLPSTMKWHAFERTHTKTKSIRRRICFYFLLANGSKHSSEWNSNSFFLFCQTRRNTRNIIDDKIKIHRVCSMYMRTVRLS